MSDMPMNEHECEQISALMDGELERDASRVIQLLTGGPSEYRQTWWRFHLIRECLSGHLARSVDAAFADRVMSAIRDEPAIVAPGRTLNRFLKPAMGFAIAASVAAVAILGLRQAGVGTPTSIQTATVAVQPQELIPRQVAARSTEPGVEQPQVPFMIPENAEYRLNRYLVNYNEYRSHTGLQGMLPYVSIVAHEVDE